MPIIQYYSLPASPPTPSPNPLYRHFSLFNNNFSRSSNVSNNLHSLVARSLLATTDHHYPELPKADQFSKMAFQIFSVVLGMAVAMAFIAVAAACAYVLHCCWEAVLSF